MFISTHFGDIFIVFIRFSRLSRSVLLISHFLYIRVDQSFRLVWPVFRVRFFRFLTFFLGFVHFWYFSSSCDTHLFRNISYAWLFVWVVEGNEREAPLLLVFEEFTMFTPFLRFFHRFYPFFASISFRFDYFPFFLDTWSIIFFDYLASFLVFVLLPILNPFPRFRSFFLFLSFVRHFFRNMSYATRKRLYSWARLFVCNYKLHQTLIFYQKKGIPWQKTSSNLGLVWPDSLVLFFGTVNWQINTLVRRFLSHFCGLDGRTLVFYQKMVYRDRKRHLTWVWCTLITWFEKMIP